MFKELFTEARKSLEKGKKYKLCEKPHGALSSQQAFTVGNVYEILDVRGHLVLVKQDDSKRESTISMSYFCPEEINEGVGTNVTYRYNNTDGTIGKYPKDVMMDLEDIFGDVIDGYDVDPDRETITIKYTPKGSTFLKKIETSLRKHKLVNP